MLHATDHHRPSVEAAEGTAPLPDVVPYRKGGDARGLRCARGATLAEVVIAATLLTFVVLGAIGAVSRSLAMTNQARMVTLSSQVLQSAVEDLRLKNYAVIKAYAAQPQPVDLTSTITSDMLASGFTSSMTLRAHFTTVHPSSTTELGLVAVELTVTWRDNNVGFSRSARTSFSEKGLSDYIYVGF